MMPPSTPTQSPTAGKSAGVDRLVTEPAADLGPPVSVAGDAIQAALLLDDAGETKIGRVETARPDVRKTDSSQSVRVETRRTLL